MPVTHLTDIVVSRIKEPGTYFDETTPAFGIRVGKNRKAWVITRGTDRQRVTVGHYPTMSLADARKEAQMWLDRMRIPKTAAGGQFDLTEAARSLRFEPKFKSMVLEAARRILKSRDITAVIKDEEPAE